ncbi:MAG: proliferating cell nuclear antigen (pcna) [Candidatus Hermodarchaeota archaeon]
MFVAKFDDAKTWQALISAISALVDEANFEISAKGMTLRAMDPSRIAMVDFELPKGAFSHFECDEEGQLGVNLDEMEKIVKRAGAGNSLTIGLDREKNQLQITLEGRTRRSFKISLIDLGADRPPTLNVDFDVNVKITADTLKEIIQDADIISDFIAIDAVPETLTISARGDTGNLEVSIGKDEEALLEYSVKQPAKSLYALEYLNDMMKAVAASDTVQMEFGKGTPIKLLFAVSSGGHITYFLAPRVEDDF